MGVLITSPLARGLFHRAIAQSGTVNSSPRPLNQAENDGVAFATALKVPARDEVAYLRRLSVNEIVGARVPLFPAMEAGRGSIRHIVIDGYAVPSSPAAVFAEGKEQSAPLMIGSNARERSPSVTTLPTDLPATLRRMYGPLAERAIALYANAADDPVFGTPAEQWAGDSGFRCDSTLQALWHTQAGHSAYQYVFSRAAPGRETIGAVHSSEIWYVFGSLGLGTAPGGPAPHYNDIDRATSNVMQTYWTNFAKTGDPNGSDLPHWPKFDSASRSYLLVKDQTPVSGKGPRRPFCDLYIANVQRMMTARR